MKLTSYRKYWKAIVAFLFIGPLLLSIYFGVQKQGYFVDEVWSYGLANSKNYAHLLMQEGWDADWIEPSYFENYIEVQPGEEFSYGAVFRNQTEDNHPPLFYLVLHTVSSFFPNKFSKWFGIVPNLFYLLITNVFLYKILKKLTDSRGIAGAGMLFYALSAGAISCAIYIRMYMMLTMCIMILLYLDIRIYESKELRSLDFVACALVTFAGCMTQYFFYIAVFFGAGIFAFLLLICKKWKEMFGFITANISSLVLVKIVFPISFTKIFGNDNDRGAEAHRAFEAHHDIVEKFRSFYSIINQQLYNNLLTVIVLLIIIGIAVAGIYCVVKKKRPELGWQNTFMVVPTAVSLGYLTMMAFVAPYQSDRYIFIIYPVTVICIVFAAVKIFHITHMSDKCVMILLVVCAVFFSWSEIKNNQVQYLYPEGLRNQKLAEEYSEDDCIYISDQSYLITADVPEVMKYRRVLKRNYEDLASVQDWLDPETKEVIVYFDWVLGVDIDNMEIRGNEIAGDLGMNHWEHLYSTDKCCVFRIYD